MQTIVSPTHDQIATALVARTQSRLERMTDSELYNYCANAVFQERTRLLQDTRDATSHYTKLIDNAAHALRAGRVEKVAAIGQLVECYAHEIHNRFSQRTYAFATRFLPGALTRLLTASTQPIQLVSTDVDPVSRIVVRGPLDTIRELAKTHTLIYAPTHLSNLDSPLIGYALHASRLPPCVYGAGLNLFDNPTMSFFMSRLGAYTVDRRKRLVLYKDVLKDYSTELIGRQTHSLFFPGGTRSRSGAIESNLKKGLLGTAIKAWQESFDSPETQRDILVVPITLSFALVLEAETLIEDSLAEEGKARYIISDDEFSEARTVASFSRHVLNLDSSAFITFGQPLDLIGNPVNDDGVSLGPRGQPIDRREYITDPSGVIHWDSQRDRVYTQRLTQSLIAAYRRDNVVLSTHLTGLVAWSLLSHAHPHLNRFQLVLIDPQRRWLSYPTMIQGINRARQHVIRLHKEGEIQWGLPEGDAEAILNDALRRFDDYHQQPVLRRDEDRILVSPKLTLYYGNRLRGYGLEQEIIS